METGYLDLLELQHAMREGIETLFPGRLWVRAEIASMQVKTNGHCYLDLSQVEEGKIVAKAKAVIWRGRFAPISAYFREVTGEGMRAGIEVLARVQVSYSELYGLTLTIDEVEPRFTLGAAELQKRRTIEQLTQEGLMDRQKQLSLPELPRRLAVVSARDAAGFGDFCRHLSDNEYGFAFSVELFEATMQGLDSPASIADAIARVECRAEEFDAVLVMRGGGSALDLACFDDYGMCLAIANCSLPVFTAIGHERDHHVADMVACDFVKTPTAMADLFIDAIAAEDERIASFGTRLRLAFSARIAEMTATVDQLASRIRSADPRMVLSRGYTLVTDESGVVLKSASGLVPGSRIKVLFGDGAVDAVVDSGR